ncbi:E3 SUMO-protein ligase ZNF451 [Octopus bimaculoides]|uniref:C2H2-type domain-containing protein n=1 Tax=Octopus bimaculoides TaxID=37653 RepID=A0A0L8H4G1_OCTBM|nr:E3 SUMO-protein ligase ZNF451 [Octopus bimaculoides]|eukprot:XP_014775616.1 PREDICTED: zinc finger protein 451-like [Octopus bimaculoides]
MDNNIIILDSSDSEASVLEITPVIKVQNSTCRKKNNSVIVVSDSSDCEIVSPLPEMKCQNSVIVSTIKSKRKRSLNRNETLKNNSVLTQPKPKYSVGLHSLHSKSSLVNPSKPPPENQATKSPQNKTNECHHNQTKPSKKDLLKTPVKLSPKINKTLGMPTKIPTRFSPRLSSMIQAKQSLRMPTKISVSHPHCTPVKVPVRQSSRNIAKSTRKYSPRKLAKNPSKKPISMLKSSHKILKMFASKSNKIPSEKSTKKRVKHNVYHNKEPSSNKHIIPQSTNLQTSLNLINNTSNLNGLNSLFTSNSGKNLQHNCKGNGIQTQFCCPVINCEIKFSSKENLQNHMDMMIHNSCNPSKSIMNSFLSCEILNYICPKCGKEFKFEQACSEHQRSSNHNAFIKPVPISSYICQTCLLIFSSRINCLMHMSTTKHHLSAFSFQNNSEHVPVPLPKVLETDFRRKCDMIPNYITCTNCSDVLCEPTAVTNHINNHHIVKCVSKKSLKDIFSNYLGDITCSSCQQIFHKSTNRIIGMKHQCTFDKSGILLKNNCKSFREFVLRSSLSLHFLNLLITSADLVLQNPKANCHHNNLKTNLKVPSKRRRVKASVSLSNFTCNNKSSTQFPFSSKQFNPPTIWSTQDLDCYREKSELINKLTQMKHIIFLDLDNWTGIFKHVHHYFPNETFLWAFYGAKTKWFPPKSDVYKKLVQDGCFFLNPKSGYTKQAADFALVLHVGKMDERLPVHIKFTILSGDKGFYEVSHQFENSKRHMQIVDPHHFTKESYNSLFQLSQV